MSVIEPTTTRRGWIDPCTHSQVGRACELTFDALTAAVLMVAPMFMGGRHPVGRLVYVVGVGALALVWLVRCIQLRQFRYRACGLEWVMLLASGLVLLQLCPLPLPWLDQLSPRIAHYLPLGRSDPSLGLKLEPWRTLSLTPAHTRMGLAVWNAHVLFLVLLVQRLETRRDLRRLVVSVAASGIVLAALGMLQYLFSNGRFLWIYEDPFRNTRDVVRGPFYNENHFAHLLSLTLVPLGVWLRSRRANGEAVRERFTLRSEHRGELLTLLLAAAWPCVLFTILLTRSRGGVIAALVVVLVGAVGIIARDGLRRTHAFHFLFVIGTLLFALTIHGMEQVRREVDTLATTSLDELDARAGRRGIWRAAREVVGQFTLCGAGVGSFRETFPLFYSEPREKDYSYAESGILQVAVETGLLGSSLMLVGLVFVGRSVWNLWPRLPSAADAEWAWAAAAGLVASFVHSAFDFVWYLPACFAMTIALLAVLIRFHGLSSLERTGPVRTNTSGALGFGTLSIAVGLLLTGIVPLFSAARASIPWNAYLLTSRPALEPAELPNDPDEGSLDAFRRHLFETVRRDPTHARAHLRLARHTLQLFELRQMVSDNPMSLAQIRDAALASNFASIAAQDRWLDAALGPNRTLLDEALVHTRMALKLSPLQGVGYAYLAELAFLQSPHSRAPTVLVNQALRLRPYDPTVLFAAGREAIFRGNASRAIVHWRQAYYQDHELRQRITLQLAPQLPADLFIAQFEPDPGQLLALIQFYREQGMAENAAIAGRILLDQLVDGRWARRHPAMDETLLWRHGYTLAAELSDPRRVAIAQRAVELNPRDYTMRRRLALELLGQQAWDRAIEHLSWCREEMPTDRGVAEKLRWAREQIGASNQRAVHR